EQVTLQQIAAEPYESIALGGGLHALGHDRHRHLAAQAGYAANDALFRLVGVDIADQRHIELYDLGLELGEAREPRVTRAEVIDGDPEAHAAQRGDALAHVLDTGE